MFTSSYDDWKTSTPPEYDELPDAPEPEPDTLEPLTLTDVVGDEPIAAFVVGLLLGGCDHVLTAWCSEGDVERALNFTRPRTPPADVVAAERFLAAVFGVPSVLP